MIDHISIGVNDLERSRLFYDRVLAPLGYRRLQDEEDQSGYGADRALFWIGLPFNKRAATGGNGTHVCFTAPSREAVEQFYKIAIEQKATDDGGPGIRPIYNPNYFAAFVFDPDGNKIEAVIQLNNNH